MKKIDVNELKQFIRETSEQSRIYIGCDSFRHKKNGKWFASFTVVVIVHIDGRHGCRVFGDITTEPDYDTNKKRPAMRLMSEVYKAVDMFEQLKDALGDREVELHLDINPNKKYGSSVVVDQAIGYVRGVAGITPMVKPEGFAATHCADHFRTFSGRS
jgi:uncharacterized protein